MGLRAGGSNPSLVPTIGAVIDVMPKATVTSAWSLPITTIRYLVTCTAHKARTHECTERICRWGYECIC